MSSEQKNANSHVGREGYQDAGARLTRRRLIQGSAALLSTAAAAAQISAVGASPAGAPARGVSRGQASKLDLGGYNGPGLTSTSIKLRFLRQIYDDPTEAMFKKQYAQWAKAYPNIEVQEETVPYGDLPLKIQTYVAAGDPPDIMMGKGDFVQGYVFNNTALNLSDFLTETYINDIPSQMRDLQSVDAKLYSMPWEQGHALFYFNRDMFDAAGVATPPETADIHQGWTWEQAAEAWKGLTAHFTPSGQEPTTFALSASTYGNGGPGSSYWYEGIYIRSQGDPKASSDSSAFKTFKGVSDDGLTVSGYVDTAEAIKGMQFYQNIFKNKYTPSVAANGQFEGKQAATRISSVVVATRAKNRPDYLPFKWGVSPLPRGNIFFNHTSGDCPFVSSQSKHGAEAAALLAFLCNDDNRVAFHRTWGSMPARESLFELIPEYKEFPYSLAVASTKAGYAPPITPGYVEYFNAMNAAVKDIALGAPVEDRLHSEAQEIDSLLSSYQK